MCISDGSSDVGSSDRKPDLRNPLIITDVSSHFTGSGFGRFADIVAAGDVVRAVPAPATAEKSRKFFDDMNSWAQGEGFEIGRAHVCTTVTNAHLVCRLLLENKNKHNQLPPITNTAR